MAIFTCKMCGATLNIEEGKNIATCNYCGTAQTLPSQKNEKIAAIFNRANHFRLHADFDKAQALYEKIIEEGEKDCEAHWGVVLCKYGIEYVDDSKTHTRIPTCHRTQVESVLADIDYQEAIKLCDKEQKSIYQREAKVIDKIQKGILSIVQDEEPYDIFICYKETDENGKRTRDSVIANDIYYKLTEEGYKVFYAAITLEDKLGREYEPYIFAALNSAKIMLAVGTKPEFFNAPWVKNEWSRYLKLMKTDRNRLLIPCYRDMDAYDLPEEFAHLQAQDMGKIGFIEDVIRGIKKIIKKNEPKTVVQEKVVKEPVKETVVVQENAATPTITPLLKRARLFLEDKDFESADEYAEKVLDLNPECADAYMIKLLSGLQIANEELLIKGNKSFGNNPHYLKAKRFAKGKRLTQIEGYYTTFMDGLYDRLKRQTAEENTAEEYARLAREWESLGDYKDSKRQGQICAEQAAIVAKQEGIGDNYNKAKKEAEKGTAQAYFSAIEMLEKYPDWKDSAQLISEWTNKAEELEKTEKLKLRRQVEKGVYDSACKLMKNGDVASYKLAIEKFSKILDYMAAKQKIEECHRKIAERQQQTKALLEKQKKQRIKTWSWVGVALAVVLVLVMIFIYVPAYDSVQRDGIYYEKVDEGYEIVKVKDKENVQSVVIPDKLRGLPVTKIRDEVFANCSSLTSVEIPDSVTSIGQAAFRGCSNLTSIEISNSVTSIGQAAFRGCSNLTSIEISNSVTSIGQAAFSGCSSLTSVEIPDSVTSIDKYAFNGCSGLTSIKIPDSVTFIGSSAFSGCSGLTSITIPNSVTSIDRYAFNDCSGLTSIKIPDSVTFIGSSAFSGCSGLTSITIPDSVTEIGVYTFSGCSGLTSITIPDSVTEIGVYTFSGCSSLISITIPDSVTEIGQYAFRECTSLNEVYYEGMKNEWENIQISYNNGTLSRTTVYYYSETQPTGSGLYWHYVDGVPTVWGVSE